MSTKLIILGIGKKTLTIGDDTIVSGGVNAMPRNPAIRARAELVPYSAVPERRNRAPSNTFERRE